MLNAQTAKEEIELFQSILRMEKKAAVAEVITLSGEAGTVFWNLYDNYESERKQHGQKRIDLLVKYANEYLKKSSGIKTASQFYQLEVYFQSAIRLSIMEQIPFIGEFE